MIEGDDIGAQIAEVIWNYAGKDQNRIKEIKNALMEFYDEWKAKQTDRELINRVRRKVTKNIRIVENTLNDVDARPNGIRKPVMMPRKGIWRTPQRAII